MGRLRWVLPAVLMLSLAMIVAGCGGDDDNNTSQYGTYFSDIAYGAAPGASIFAVGMSEGPLDGVTFVGGADIALQKYDSDLNTVWIRQQGTITTDIAYAASSDSNGNVYAAGTTYGNLDGHWNQGVFDIAVVKYDAAGTKIWTQQLGTDNNEMAFGTATDGMGHVFVTGFTEGGLDGNTNLGLSDIFLTKYDASGARLWTRQWGSIEDESGLAVASDSDGNAYVTGYTRGNFDGNIAVSSADIFITKVSADGVKLWTVFYGSGGYEAGTGIGVDPTGYIYITGSTDGPLGSDTNFGGSDAFIAKFNPDGDLQWSEMIGTQAVEYGKGLAMDSTGMIYVAGTTYGGLHGNTNQGLGDAFLSKYDADGNLQWTKQAGTPAEDQCNALAIDADDFVFIVGGTEGDINHINMGQMDMFIMKFDASGNRYDGAAVMQ